MKPGAQATGLGGPSPFRALERPISTGATRRRFPKDPNSPAKSWPGDRGTHPVFTLPSGLPSISRTRMTSWGGRPSAERYDLNSRHVTLAKTKFFERFHSHFFGLQIWSKIRGASFPKLSDENFLLNVGGAVPAATRKGWLLREIAARSRRHGRSQISIGRELSRLHENFSDRKEKSSEAVANECGH